MTLPMPRLTDPLGGWDPVRELDEFHARMTRLMSSVFGIPSGADADRWTPLADVRETEDAFLVEVEVPGVKRDDIDVQVAGSELTISGEFKERERTGWLRSRTRRIGRFHYRTTLPADVDSGAITAELADGVLTVRVPKSEAVRPKRIPITSR